MSARQGGACAICRQRPARGLVIDHCHSSNKVRALLCSNCNSGLGLFQENPSRLQAAMEYIAAFSGDDSASWAQSLARGTEDRLALSRQEGHSELGTCLAGLLNRAASK